MFNSMVLSIWSIVALSGMHPFHISVCDVEFDEDSKALEIGCRIFVDDLEETLRIFSGDEKLDVINPTDPARLSQVIESYYSTRLDLRVNGREVESVYLGNEREEDVMWSFIEVPKVKKLNRLEIENSLLLETFDDQINIVHVKAFDETKSLKLYQHNDLGELTY